MILGRVNIICTLPRTDEVDPFFWPEPSSFAEVARQLRHEVDSADR